MLSLYHHHPFLREDYKAYTRPGEMAAVDNGDATSHESFQPKERPAHNGLRLVVVRSKAGAPGRVTLRAYSEGLKSGDVTVRSRRVRRREELKI